MRQRSTAPGGANMEKYRAVPRTRVPVAEGEIRVSMNGRIPLYITYAGRLFNEQNMKTVTIKATGNAIPSAITLTEILKRRFENLHQQNLIGISRTVDKFEPMEVGLDHVMYERDVPFLEIILTKEISSVDPLAFGYQKPVDQSLVRFFPVTPNKQPGNGEEERQQPRRGRGRGAYRGRGMYSGPPDRGASRGGRGGRGMYRGAPYALRWRGLGTRGSSGFQRRGRGSTTSIYDRTLPPDATEP